MGATLYRWVVNAFQGQWHKLFGHPKEAMLATSPTITGIRTAVFKCKECGREFEKVVRKWY